jgi:hypothetical protein
MANPTYKEVVVSNCSFPDPNPHRLDEEGRTLQELEPSCGLSLEVRGLQTLIYDRKTRNLTCPATACRFHTQP